MPIYEYGCTVGSCGHELEALQKMADEPLLYCPACGEASLKKKISAAQDRKQGSAGKIYDELVLYNQHNLGNWMIIVLMLLLSIKVIKPYISTINVNEIKSKGEQAMKILK